MQGGFELIFSAHWVAVASEVTYPVVYVFAMSGLSSAKAVVALATQAAILCRTSM